MPVKIKEGDTIPFYRSKEPMYFSSPNDVEVEFTFSGILHASRELNDWFVSEFDNPESRLGPGDAKRRVTVSIPGNDLEQHIIRADRKARSIGLSLQHKVIEHQDSVSEGKSMRNFINMVEDVGVSYKKPFRVKQTLGSYNIVDANDVVVVRKIANSRELAQKYVDEYNADKQIAEQADADDMYGDASRLKTVGRQNGQEYSDRGRGDVKPRPNMDARFADNPMDNAQINEYEDFDSSYVDQDVHSVGPENLGQLDQLHQMLTRLGISDAAIRQGGSNILAHSGKQKVAGKFGISVDDVDLLLSSLEQNLNDADAKDTDALVDDYYSMMGEGANVPMVIRTLERREKWKTEPKNDKQEDRENARKRDVTKRDARKSKDGQKKSVAEDKKTSSMYLAGRMCASEFSDKSTRAYNKAKAKEADENAKKKEPTKSSTKKKVAEASTLDFDTENNSYEPDVLGNVTIRDKETGEERFVRGSEATDLLAHLKYGGDDFNEFPLDEDDEDFSGDFDAEIEAPAGTYNFPWDYHGEHGLGTAFYRTDVDKPMIRIESVRDDHGDEIDDVDPAMHKALMDQAKGFIGHE